MVACRRRAHAAGVCVTVILFREKVEETIFSFFLFLFLFFNYAKAYKTEKLISLEDH